METSPVSESAAGSARRPMPLLDHEALFEALPGLFLILDTELRIVAVTNAYAAAKGGMIKLAELMALDLGW